MRPLLLAALVALPALAQDEPRYPLRLTIPGVANAAQVSPVLYRGAQPTGEGFQELKKLGVKGVISMRSGQEDEKLAKGLGLFTFRIPTVQWRALDRDVVAALKVIVTPSYQPVFVHCQAGKDRTGLVVGAYQVLFGGKSVDQAQEERRSFGALWLYRANEDYLERLRLPKVRDELRARVEKAPVPSP